MLRRRTVPQFLGLGMLYDSTLCVGCQACVTKCQEINHPEPMERGDTYANVDPIWSNNDKLSPYTNNIIQIWRDGTGENKDQLKTVMPLLRNNVCIVLMQTVFLFVLFLR